MIGRFATIMKLTHLLTHSLTYVDVSEWDVSRVTDMSNMFNGATSFNKCLSMPCTAQFAIPSPPYTCLNIALDVKS